jgi:hypothetical protein
MSTGKTNAQRNKKPSVGYTRGGHGGELAMDRPRSQRITLREGRRGARERFLYTRPWGLDLARIAIPGCAAASSPVKIERPFFGTIRIKISAFNITANLAGCSELPRVVSAARSVKMTGVIHTPARQGQRE